MLLPFAPEHREPGKVLKANFGGKEGGASPLLDARERALKEINLPPLMDLLSFYPNWEVASYIADGFAFGFRIPAPTPSAPTSVCVGA